MSRRVVRGQDGELMRHVLILLDTRVIPKQIARPGLDKGRSVVWGGESDFNRNDSRSQDWCPPLPLLHRNDCLDKKYVPCRENILHHARKLEIFDGRAGYFLLAKSTQFMLPQLPPQVWEIRSDVFIPRELFNNIETQITSL